MSKERLEEIKRNWKKGYEFVDDGNEKFQFDKDFNWLIEQAENNFAHLKTSTNWMNEALRLEQQNKRYREAIEEMEKIIKKCPKCGNVDVFSAKEILLIHSCQVCYHEYKALEDEE